MFRGLQGEESWGGFPSLRQVLQMAPGLASPSFLIPIIPRPIAGLVKLYEERCRRHRISFGTVLTSLNRESNVHNRAIGTRAIKQSKRLRPQTEGSRWV